MLELRPHTDHLFIIEGTLLEEHKPSKRIIRVKLAVVVFDTLNWQSIFTFPEAEIVKGFNLRAQVGKHSGDRSERTLTSTG